MANPSRTEIPLSVQVAMASVIVLFHNRFHHQYQLIQEKGKEIAAHSAQGRKTPNIVLNVRYALHTFALNIQNPM